jgi:hypothetical protein
MLGEKTGSDSFFDHVIFCTNVTYADGHFKGGRLSVFSDTYHLVTFSKRFNNGSSAYGGSYNFSGATSTSIIMVVLSTFFPVFTRTRTAYY